MSLHASERLRWWVLHVALPVGLAWLLAQAASAGDPTIRDLRRLHQEAWRRGGVCRHAAALVWDACRQAQVPCRVVRFGTYKSPITHVIPVVDLDGWKAIDTFYRGSTPYAYSRELHPDEPDVGKFRNIGLPRRPLTKRLHEPRETDLLRWLDQFRKLEEEQ